MTHSHTHIQITPTTTTTFLTIILIFLYQKFRRREIWYKIGAENKVMIFSGNSHIKILFAL